MKTHNQNKKYKIELTDGVLHLTRDEMTNAFREYFISLWVFTQDVNSLEETLLFSGWKALSEYTDEELVAEIEGLFDKKLLVNLLQQRELRWTRELEDEAKNRELEEADTPL